MLCCLLSARQGTVFTSDCHLGNLKVWALLLDAMADAVRKWSAPLLSVAVRQWPWLCCTSLFHPSLLCLQMVAPEPDTPSAGLLQAEARTSSQESLAGDVDTQQQHTIPVLGPHPHAVGHKKSRLSFSSPDLWAGQLSEGVRRDTRTRAACAARQQRFLHYLA